MLPVPLLPFRTVRENAQVDDLKRWGRPVVLEHRSSFPPTHESGFGVAVGTRGEVISKWEGLHEWNPSGPKPEFLVLSQQMVG